MFEEKSNEYSEWNVVTDLLMGFWEEYSFSARLYLISRDLCSSGFYGLVLDTFFPRARVDYSMIKIAELSMIARFFSK